MSYTHFTLFERFCLEDLLNQGKSIREIAKTLGRNPSSVSRELKRNWSKGKDRYNPWRATTLYIMRRKKCKRKYKINQETELYNIIEECLKKYWSPEIIENYCKKSGYPISFSTIYNAVKAGFFADIKPKTHFRRRGKKKHAKNGKHATIHPEHTIHERPEEANNRSRLGDWEGDTICGAKNKSCLVSQVDRESKMLTLALSINHSMEEVRKATKRAFELLEVPMPVHTITLDNGSEFADFKGIEEDNNTTVYFADPHAPWQRGLNENTNDIVRFFFPKGTDFSTVSEEELLKVVHLINSRPRKCLGYLSPLDYIKKKCCT